LLRSAVRPVTYHQVAACATWACNACRRRCGLGAARLRPVRVNPATAPFVVVAQSRRLSAGQDTIPAPDRRNAPDGLLALHFVPCTASPLRAGAPWRPWRVLFSLRIYPHRSREFGAGGAAVRHWRGDPAVERQPGHFHLPSAPSGLSPFSQQVYLLPAAAGLGAQNCGPAGMIRHEQRRLMGPILSVSMAVNPSLNAGESGRSV